MNRIRTTVSGLCITADQRTYASPVSNAAVRKSYQNTAHHACTQEWEIFVSTKSPLDTSLRSMLTEELVKLHEQFNKLMEIFFKLSGNGGLHKKNILKSVSASKHQPNSLKPSTMQVQNYSDTPIKIENDK